MRIAVIGTGNVGRAIGGGWTRVGHAVTYGSRTPEGGDQALPTNAVIGADVVAIALPWGAAEATIRGLGPLTGQIVIDCMNPLGMGPDGLGLLLGHTTSGAETVQSWLPQARVIKTLNQVGAEVTADTTGFPTPPVMFMAGDDPAAKATVATLLTDLGFEALDAGPLSKARLLEPFAMTWINQAMLRGHGRDWAFTAAKRTHP
ncbi:MAG: NADPH-dependent F420 reductase [Paracoccaceae bacterium]